MSRRACVNCIHWKKENPNLLSTQRMTHYSVPPLWEGEAPWKAMARRMADDYINLSLCPNEPVRALCRAHEGEYLGDHLDLDATGVHWASEVPVWCGKYKEAPLPAYYAPNYFPPMPPIVSRDAPDVALAKAKDPTTKHRRVALLLLPGYVERGELGMQEVVDALIDARTHNDDTTGLPGSTIYGAAIEALRKLGIACGPYLDRHTDIEDVYDALEIDLWWASREYLSQEEKDAYSDWNHERAIQEFRFMQPELDRQIALRRERIEQKESRHVRNRAA